MRTRYVKPAMFSDERFADLDDGERFLFLALQTLADSAGRLPDKPREIRAKVYPYNPERDVDAMLSKLHPKLIFRYEVEGERFIEILDFVQEQRPHPKEPATELPGIPSEEMEKHGKKFLSVSKSEKVAKGRISIREDKSKRESKSKEGGVGGNGTDRFEAFWLSYPRKVGKGAARKAWEKIRPTAVLELKIMCQVDAAKKTSQWQKDGGQFIPHAATWLNQSRWEDDYREVEDPGTERMRRMADAAVAAVRERGGPA